MVHHDAPYEEKEDGGPRLTLQEVEEDGGRGIDREGGRW